jgi:hypothetical protein
VRHRTLSGAPATSPGRWVLTVGALTGGASGLSGGAPDKSFRMSGAPSGVALTLPRTVAFAVDRWHEVAVAPLAHRTVSHFPEGGKFSFEFPGAPDTVRWHTGQSGAPDQGTLRLSFALFV